MFDNNPKHRHEECLRCGIKGKVIDKNAVAVKLTQAARSIEYAIDACNDQELTNLFSFINCANSYLIEASDKAGKPRL